MCKSALKSNQKLQVNSHDEPVASTEEIKYTRFITPKRVTSGGIHLRDLTPGQHSSEETSQRWRAVGDTVSDLTGPGSEP